MLERLLSRNSAKAVLIAAVVLAAFVEVMLTIGGASFDPAGAAWIVGGAVVVVVSGLLVVDWSIPDRGCPGLTLAILAGSAATSLFLVAGCFVTGQRAAIVFLSWSLIVVAVAWRKSRRGFLIRIDGSEMAGVALIALIVALWCRHPAAAFPTIQATGIAPIWSDYFIHGAQIDQFGARLATGRSSFAISGQAVDVYHYASFMLPAAVAGVADRPGIAIAASVLFPYGVLLCLLGTYGLVRVLTTGSSGLVAALALLIVPDASTYGLRNGTLGFHWFLGASPGTGYAIGTASAALAFLAVWRRTGRRRCLWTGALLAAALVQIRVQIFVVVVPALVATLLYESHVVRRHRRGPAAMLIAAFAGLLVIVMSAAMHPQSDHFKAFRGFLDIVHTSQAPSAYDGVYVSIQRRYGPSVAQVIGFVGLVPALLGVLAFLAPVAGFLANRLTAPQPLDSFPIWCLVGWLGLAVMVPASVNAATSYQYHSFAVVYAAVFVWTLVFLRRAMAWAGYSSALHHALSGLAVTALTLGAVAASRKDPVKPRMAWAELYYGLAVDRGLLEAASFVRREAAPGDRFMLIPADPSAIDDDAAMRFAALADVPAYLTRPGLHIGKPWLRAVIEQRLAQSLELELATDAETAFELARQTGVRYLVTSGPRVPRFDPDHARAAFHAENTAVYRLARRP